MGFKMQPKGVYKKYTNKRGLPKYGLNDPEGMINDHNRMAMNTPLMAGQTAGQIVKRERLMIKDDGKVTTMKSIPIKPIPTESSDRKEKIHMGKQNTNEAKMKRYREMQRHGYEGDPPNLT